MTNIRYLLIIILCAGVGLYVRAQERPNIVLILADDIGTDDLGCYGNPFVQRPHIDRIAAEGISFTIAYVTTSSCSRPDERREGKGRVSRCRYRWSRYQ